MPRTLKGTYFLLIWSIKNVVDVLFLMSSFFAQNRFSVAIVLWYNYNPRAQDWFIRFRLSIPHSRNMRGSNSAASRLSKRL